MKEQKVINKGLVPKMEKPPARPMDIINVNIEF